MSEHTKKNTESSFCHIFDMHNKSIRENATINEYVKVCYDIAVAKGWWNEDRIGPELIALMHSELSEALEAMRDGESNDRICEELADCCIRIFDFCGSIKVDFQKILNDKIIKNYGRHYRHGGKIY